MTTALFALVLVLSGLVVLRLIGWTVGLALRLLLLAGLAVGLMLAWSPRPEPVARPSSSAAAFGLPPPARLTRSP